MKFIIAIVILLGACNPQYNQYTVSVRSIASTSQGSVERALKKHGLEVDSSSEAKVTSKWTRGYMGSNPTLEIQTRIVVDLFAPSIRAQCMYRVVKGPWKFRKCVQQGPLASIHILVSRLERELL